MDQQQSPPPQNQPLDYMRQAAALRSYTTPAMITLALYFLFWIPGVIANIVYLVAANDDRRKSGLDPQGRGCLLMLGIVFILLPVFGFCAFLGFVMVSSLASSGSAS